MTRRSVWVANWDNGPATVYSSHYTFKHIIDEREKGLWDELHDVDYVGEEFLPQVTDTSFYVDGYIDIFLCDFYE